ncbi:MAG: hypothetical protein ACHQHN_09075 [Sphingobacteriales bacterium]
MKANYLFVLFAAVVLVSSCKNEIVKPASTTTTTIVDEPSTNIAGKWNLVKDSTSNQFIGPVHNTVYIGTPSDYYDFRADGKCYISSNGSNDTVSYKMGTNNSLIFGDPVAEIDAATGETVYQDPNPTPIDPLTTHSATIIFATASPGGARCEAIYLAR